MVKADRVLADTCAWIDFFNNRGTPLAKALERHLLQGGVCTCGIVKYELVQGLKSSQEEVLLLEALRALDHLEMTESLWRDAGRLSTSLCQMGVTLPLSDILIATLAMAHGLSVLTVDRHFTQITGLRVFELPAAG
ncbi:MAG: PIN domain-containing protein [Desulfuromonadales bacterium]|nr:PIN domain-containing protein [Desulfuromonadales bacterium]